MPKVKIDEKEFEYDELSDESKQQVNNLRFVQAELQRLQSLIGVTKTAEQVYINALKNTVENQ